MNCNKGYFGYSAFGNIENVESSIYAISDSNLGEIDIIPLTIGTFKDLYNRFMQFALHKSKIRI